jgi:hypothetical protein
MLVRSLEVVHYPPSGLTKNGSSWETLDYPNPDWQTIDAAVKQLDRDVYPFVWLQIGKHVEWDEPELALNVMGGRGEFALCIFRKGHHLYFRDPSRGKKVIEIWESDQGSRAEERELCNDLNLVLKIVQHFAESGEPYPGVQWVDE